MTEEEALEVVKDAVRGIVPDADFTRIAPDDRFRDALELDSLDFLTLVEDLVNRTGCRIDEDDYPRLTTLAGAAALLAERAP
ncbi:acyl carrier protein [Streptomyces thermolineatus]|uniref:acyl carrier protein n=1 Tax=Streptomyces thermolineatus TaxID=44033 RepID=UPI00384E4784